jgi:cyanophycinase
VAEHGPIALVGGSEFTPPARPLDLRLLELSGGEDVIVVPTAVARHRPDLAVETARRHFAAIGGRVEPLMVLDRASARDPAAVERVRQARFVYLTGGDPDVLADVLRGTPVWRAILEANDAGAVVAGSSAGAMVFGPSMLGPVWDELLDGLGWLPDLVTVPHFDRLDGPRREALVEGALRLVPGFAEGAVRLLGVFECTGVVLRAGGRVDVLGAGSAVLHAKGRPLRRWSAPIEGEAWE